MTTITATEARNDLFGLIKRTNADRTVTEITSRNGNVVMLAASEWEAIQETNYLLSNPANAQHLLESIEAARRGEYQEHQLREYDA